MALYTICYGAGHKRTVEGRATPTGMVRIEGNLWRNGKRTSRYRDDGTRIRLATEAEVTAWEAEQARERQAREEAQRQIAALRARLAGVDWLTMPDKKTLDVAQLLGWIGHRMWLDLWSAS